jgi:glycosyltransferase involved in cell wall biosynthesis
MNYDYSFIVPVYNRREEIEELLKSFTKVKEINRSEILIIEDGSSSTCKDICNKYCNQLNISYYYKENSGPGDSRNFGMRKAKSDYFIILDSDVLLPDNYLENLIKNQMKNKVECYGGPDKANEGFSDIQKAINYTMTSYFTTGGLRGKDNSEKYEPRSFNMGLSKIAFEATKGFGDIHPGEDPDLVIRLKKLGYTVAYYKNCSVYHKRRIDFNKFAKQVYKFGLVRPILNSWHPESKRITYWFPTFFSIGFVLAFVLFLGDIFALLYFYVLYFTLIILDSSIKNNSLKIGVYSIISTIIQFFSYGYGFIKSSFNIFILRKDPRKIYPFLFFNLK